MYGNRHPKPVNSEQENIKIPTGSEMYLEKTLKTVLCNSYVMQSFPK